MEHACRMLSMAAGLILTCMLIGLGMLAGRESRRFGAEVIGSMEEMTEEYSEYRFTRFDETLVTGGDVVSAIRKFQDEIPVSVVQNGKCYVYEGNFRPADNVPGTGAHIRYGDDYRGAVQRNKKEEVCGLCFYREP